MVYEIFVFEFLKDKRVAVTNNCNADIPLKIVFNTAFWATHLREGEVFRRLGTGPVQTIQLILVSSNIFRSEIDCIPRGYTAAVTFDGSGIEVIQELLNDRPKGAYVFLHACA